MEWPNNLTNNHLTTRMKNIYDITVLDPCLGPQFFRSAWGDLWVQDVSLNPLHDVLYIDMSLNVSVPHQEGRLHWNIDDHTLNIPTEVDGVALQVGQEQFIRARNVSGSDIIDGQPVSVIGASGQRPEVILSNAVNPDIAMTAAGLATHSISNNQTGYISSFGLVRDVCTSNWSEGDILWISETPGELTNVRPAAPNFQFAMGVVSRSHAVNGSIFVSPRWVPRLAWLSDVSIRGTQQDGDCIRWSDDTSTWISKTPTIIEGSPASTDPGVPGEFRYDASYFYVCTSVNTWGRALLETGY